MSRSSGLTVSRCSSPSCQARRSGKLLDAEKDGEREQGGKCQQHNAEHASRAVHDRADKQGSSTSARSKRSTDAIVEAIAAPAFCTVTEIAVG